MTDQPVVRIGSLAQSISDTHPRTKERLVFLNTSDVLLGKVLHREYSTVKDWPGQARKSIRRKDILFSEIRPANGRWAFIDFDCDDFVVSTKLMVIRADTKKILPRFLYHFLTSLKTTAWLQHLAESRSGTFPQITFDQVADLEIVLPSLAAQGHITDVIDEIEDKIELNQRLSRTLETAAQGLFTDWFVEFGPTTAKQDHRDRYLASELWSRFPDRLDAQGIPEGWSPCNVGDLLDFNPPERLSKGLQAAYLDMAALPVAGPSPAAPILRPAGSGARFRNDDALFARITPCLENGKTAFIDSLRPGEIGWGSTEFVVLRSRPPVPPEFAYLLARDPAFRAHAIQSMTGTSGRQRVQPASLRVFPLVRPPDDIFREFGEFARCCFKKIAANAQETHTLIEVRNQLFGRLLSGDVHLVEADVRVREAAGA